MTYKPSSLRAQREQKGLSRRAVVVEMAMAGRPITESTLSRYESGRTQPRADDLAMLAGLFGCTVADFFEEAS